MAWRCKGSGERGNCITVNYVEVRERIDEDVGEKIILENSHSNQIFTTLVNSVKTFALKHTH